MPRLRLVLCAHSATLNMLSAYYMSAHMYMPPSINIGSHTLGLTAHGANFALQKGTPSKYALNIMLFSSHMANDKGTHCRKPKFLHVCQPA